MGIQFLENLYAKVVARLGSLAGFIPMIGNAIQVHVKEGDVAGIVARADQIDQLADALKNVSAKMRDAVADGSVDLVEGSEIAVALERAADEVQDIIKGADV